MIVIQQNSIIKIFSWFYYILPTLIASIYSMNLAAMFELPYGFFYSLV
nr:CorA family divalent cation transporter [Rickettsia canadensis]